MPSSIQLFKVDEPVPSLKLHSLEYKDGKWTYCYGFETPVKLTDRRRKNPLYILGNIGNQHIVSEQNNNLINTEIYSKQDVYDLIELQSKYDRLFRENFLEANKKLIPNLTERTFTLENKSQKANGKMIVRLLEDDGKHSTFVGRG